MRLIRLLLWIVYLFALAVIPNARSAHADPAALPVTSPTHLKAQPAPAEQALMAWLAHGADQVNAPQAGTEPHHRQNPAFWQVIVYQHFVNNNWEIYRTNGWFTQKLPLTTHDADDLLPRLTPDATTIAFVSNRDGDLDVYRMDATGNQIVRLTTTPYTDTLPAWSPDGLQIAFVSLRDGNPELYVMDQFGADQRRLTVDPAADYYPSWSPDGRRLVWVKIQPNGRWLWIMELNSGQTYPLVGPLPYLQHPVWSPAGDRIAFDYDADGDGFNEVATIQFDGSNLQTVADWSPPGNQIQSDLWLSDWTLHGDQLALTVLEYLVLDQGDLPPLFQLTHVRIGLHDFEGEPTAVTAAPGQAVMEMFPDHELLDRWPPISQVEPLPAYSRGIPLIKWSGYDTGPALLTWYDVQVRTEVNPVWQDWLVHTILTNSLTANYPLPIAPIAQTIFLRSRAWDEAGNIEPWPESPDGDAWTTLFSVQNRGRLTDLRGFPRVGVTLTVQPAAVEPGVTSETGRYQVYIAGEGEYQLQNAWLTTDGDLDLDFYEPPRLNLLQNGDFERSPSLEGWSVAGALTPTLTSAWVHTGLRAAQLGAPCSPLCLTIAITDVVPAPTKVRLIADEQDNLHLFWPTHSPNGTPSGFAYRHRAANGVWSEPVSVVAALTGELEVALDQRGAIHLIWNAFHSSAPALFHRQRAADGVWMQPQMIEPGGSAPRLFADRNGNLYLLYLHCDRPYFCPVGSLSYRVWLASATTWSERVTLATDSSLEYTLAPLSDGTLHLWWRPHRIDNYAPFEIRYTTFRLDAAQVTAGTRWAESGYLSAPIALVDNDDTIHVWTLGEYRTRPAGGVWSDPLQLTMLAPVFYALDAANTVHSLTDGARPHFPWHYRYRLPGKPWTAFAQTAFTTGDPPGDHISAMAAGSANTLHIVTSNGDYVTTRTWSEAGTSSLSQSTAIPTDIHQPTLAFLYMLDGGGGESQFQVILSDPLTTTTLFSTTTSTPWTLHWTDLTPWRGQTVTVTFAVEQAAGEPPLHVYLDEVALGPWETPVLLQTYPLQVEYGAAAILVITGENFLPTPTVRVGDVTLTEVQLSDEQRLEATLPPTLAPGVYDLTVTNPGGVASRRMGALVIGERLYLPLLLFSTRS